MKLRTLQKAGSSEGFVSEASAMHERPAITMEHRIGEGGRSHADLQRLHDPDGWGNLCRQAAAEGCATGIMSGGVALLEPVVDIRAC